MELLKSVLQRIENTEEKVHAYALVTAETALAAASVAEREIVKGEWKSPLHGVPVNLKDLFYTKGILTEAGSKVLRGFVPEFDSGVTERLYKAGAILVGKSVTHEFA